MTTPNISSVWERICRFGVMAKDKSRDPQGIGRSACQFMDESELQGDKAAQWGFWPSLWPQMFASKGKKFDSGGSGIGETPHNGLLGSMGVALNVSARGFPIMLGWLPTIGGKSQGQSDESIMIPPGQGSEEDGSRKPVKQMQVAEKPSIKDNIGSA